MSGIAGWKLRLTGFSFMCCISRGKSAPVLLGETPFLVEIVILNKNIMLGSSQQTLQIDGSALTQGDS